MLDKNCRIPAAVLAHVKKSIVFVGKKEGPSWKIFSKPVGENEGVGGAGAGANGNYNMLRGVVSCPCTGMNRKKLKEEEARERIMGEIAALVS